MTADRPADLVLTGGRVATMDAARSWASALAVRDERIVAVGPDDVVRPHIGPSTRVIELRGRTVTPGFQDAHVHPVHGGLARLRCELHDTTGTDAYLAIIAEYARIDSPTEQRSMAQAPDQQRSTPEPSPPEPKQGEADGSV